MDGLFRTGRLLTHHKSAMINWCGGTHPYVQHSEDRSRIVSLRPSWAVSKIQNKNQKELKKKKKSRASKMALVANPDDPNSSPGIYMVQGEKQLLKVVFWPPQVDCGICAHTQKSNRKYFQNSQRSNSDNHY